MKRATMLLMLMVLIVGIFAVGCTKSPAPSPKSEQPKQSQKEGTQTKAPQVSAASLKDYFPLTQGKTWDYQGEGNEYAAFSRKVVYTKGELGQVREDNGGTVSAAVFKVADEVVTRVYFVGEAYDDKNYLDAKANDNMVIIKAPIQVGTKWTEANGTREIVEVHAKVDTPYGSFNDCILVKASDKESTTYEYYQKGVGLVKREFVSGETKVTSSLKALK